jgi:hypothetical protein
MIDLTIINGKEMKKGKRRGTDEGNKQRNSEEIKKGLKGKGDR